MSADDIFNAAVAIARDVIDNRQSHGARLRDALENCGIRVRDIGACYDAASEFAAPYLARIAELEAENKALSEDLVKLNQAVDEVVELRDECADNGCLPESLRKLDIAICLMSAIDTSQVSECSTCAGLGHNDYEPCADCHGTGSFPP